MSFAARTLKVGLQLTVEVVKYFSGGERKILTDISQLEGRRELKFLKALIRLMKYSCFFLFTIFSARRPLPFFAVYVVSPPCSVGGLDFIQFCTG